MCHQHYYHYTKCNHRFRRLSVCLNRNNDTNCPLDAIREIHYEDRCRSCIAYAEQLPNILQHLQLNDRFHVSAAWTEMPTFNTVEYDEYDELQEAPSDEDDNSSASLAIEMYDDDFDDCGSPRCTFGLPSPPPVSPTSFDGNSPSSLAEYAGRDKILDSSNSTLSTHPGGHGQTECEIGADPVNSTAKPLKKKLDLPQSECRNCDHVMLD
ncbi:hypothetical protein EJ07DRAFT_153980 [Lizonia empirigonia]|nr:hypothetical protein EJ07DRAFT_153980 [Lizonia empirigonia]